MIIITASAGQTNLNRTGGGFQQPDRQGFENLADTTLTTQTFKVFKTLKVFARPAKIAVIRDS